MGYGGGVVGVVGCWWWGGGNGDVCVAVGPWECVGDGLALSLEFLFDWTGWCGFDGEGYLA